MGGGIKKLPETKKVPRGRIGAFGVDPDVFFYFSFRTEQRKRGTSRVMEETSGMFKTLKGQRLRV